MDNSNIAIVNMVHYLEDEFKKLKGAYDNSQRLKENIKAHMEERQRLYESLDNLLNNEISHEKEMWYETLKTRVQEVKDRNITIIQKNKDSDIDEMNIGGLSFPTNYPDSKIKDRFESILRDIEAKEKEIRREKENYHGAVSQYNFSISFFEKNIDKAEQKFVAYNNILNEGTARINECRYHGSFLYNLSSEKAKDEINLDTLSHRVDQFKNTLEIIKRNVSQYQPKTFVEMQY